MILNENKATKVHLSLTVHKICKNQNYYYFCKCDFSKWCVIPFSYMSFVWPHCQMFVSCQ